ncbi:hypothetical protein WSM22_39720 [Cytophagales bacterium WSM2-2]|nr:hypothetical protein WSM22_39720 [Cytophagales bacterium WSM2-2]
MFRDIFLFEFTYRRGRPATYVYCAIAFLLGFLAVASSVIKLGGPIGTIHANAPFIIYRMTLVASFVLSIITSAVVSVSIIRDFDHRMDSILFSMPIEKQNYLLGRFLGSFVLLIIINSALFVGFITGFALGKIVPWDVAWKGEELLPFALSSYLHPFLLFTLPNLFFTSALFFMSGALGRSSLVIYLQGVLLLVLYQIAIAFLRELDSQYIAGIIDPFSIQTFLFITKYWTPVEQDTKLIPLEGAMLYNRLLWIFIGMVALVVTVRFFSFTSARSKGGRQVKEIADDNLLAAPVTLARIDSWVYVRQVFRLTLMYFRMVWSEKAFIAIVGSGIFFFFLAASKIASVYGTGSYPVTAIMIDQINSSFNLFLTIVIVFYTGELLWKERSLNLHQIYDTLPVPTFVSLFSKFFGLILVYALLFLLLILCSILVQTSYHYYRFELSVYFTAFFWPVLAAAVSVTMLFLFLQVLSGNKFAGFVWCVVFFILNALLNQFGMEHDLWQFGSATLGSYSDMNALGHFVKPFVAFKVYWFAFSFALFMIAVVFYVRGTESSWRERWLTGKQRLSKSIAFSGLMAVVVFCCSGTYIYYNTNVINTYEHTEDKNHRKASYERTLKKYKNTVQPKIVESNSTIALYPSQRSFTAEGFFYLKNKSTEGQESIHIQSSMDHHVRTEVNFDRPFKPGESYPELCYSIYRLDSALKPGDSLKMNFKITYTSTGFEEGRSNTDIVFNGTFFNNSYFPGIGYNPQLELKDKSDRKKNALKLRDELPNPDNNGITSNVFGNSADHIRFEMRVSTDGDQVAIAPGELVKEWKENGRNYFHYKMNQPVINFYSVLSGRFHKRKDHWNNVELEIYYNPGHEYNLERMMAAMKDALNYCSQNFSPFPYKQLRIVEFPRYNTFAQSFAGTIPFSEGIGFLLKADDPAKDLDMAYYVTAHEVAHQWWGNQLMAGSTKGNAVISESLSQYTAMMVMKKNYSPELLELYLKYELDNYLKGRTQERDKESPLVSVEDQPYVYYNKAALVFYTLQSYIGEEKMNTALKRFDEEWLVKKGTYPTTKDLIKSIASTTPDSLKYLIHDMLESIILFENEAVDAVYREDKKGKFEVTLTVSCEKINALVPGQDQREPLNDWIDVGIYAKDNSGKEKLIYLKKHLIKKKFTNLVIPVKVKPTRAGIDPLHQLPDRHSNDNTITVKEFINITSLPIDLN